MSTPTQAYSIYSVYGRPPASRMAVAMLPSVAVMEEGMCVICMEEWRKSDVATELPCKHKYHFECVEQWLEIHATCPQGEEQVMVNNVEVDDDDDGEYSDYYDSDSDK